MEKMMDLIVTHYNESADIIKPLFDSIVLQQCVDFKKFGVIVVNDGESEIPESFFQPYRDVIDIEIINAEHSGVSTARNIGIKASQAEYIQLCDCDDLYCSVFGFLYIENEIKKNEFDVLNPYFIEETRKPTGEIGFFTHKDDYTFVHGKVYRRAWLLKNNLLFDPELSKHEDGCFNALVHACVTPHGERIVKNPYYLWKWRKGSVCRQEDFVLRTYTDLIECREHLLKEFKRRNLTLPFSTYSALMVLDCYFAYNTPLWQKAENKEYVDVALKRLQPFWNKYKSNVLDLTPEMLQIMMAKCREKAVACGLVNESITFNDFIAKLETL